MSTKRYRPPAMKRQRVLHGRVIPGDNLGRKLGYPTANLDDRYFKNNPQPKGVYASRVWWRGTRYDGIAVIGVPGKLEPAGKRELYLLDFDGDLYAEELTAELITKIRPLTFYRTEAALTQRIAEDIRIGRRLLRRAHEDEQRKHRAVHVATKELERGLRHVPEILHTGRSEREVRDKLLKLFPSFAPSFPFIVASGPSAAFMHHVPTTRKLRKGDGVVIDLGITVDGFCSDLTRTYFLGNPGARYRQRYLAVLRAQERAMRHVKPFTHARSVDAIARGHLRKRRLHRAFIHNTGHGVGQKIHEPPSLGPKSVDMLHPGQVVTVEPGVYFSGWGGIRIEDMMLITDKDAQHLSKKIPRRLKDVIV